MMESRNFFAMVPTQILIPFVHSLPLDLDLFSAGVNNCFVKFCCAPEAATRVLATYIDGFQVLADVAVPVHALCNPFFHSVFIQRLLDTLVRRMTSDHASTLLLYVGPPLPPMFTTTYREWCLFIAAPAVGTFPFVNPMTGHVMPGFPYPLELWVLGDVDVHEAIPTFVQSLPEILRTIVQWRGAKGKFRIRWQSILPAVRTHADKFLPSTTLMTLWSRYRGCCDTAGRLFSASTLLAHEQFRQQLHLECHPHVMEACVRFGATWSMSVVDPQFSYVYLVVCLACHRLYVGSSERSAWTRFIEELRTARRSRHFYVRHGAGFQHVLHRMNYNDHLCHCGVHNSVVTVLRRFPATVTTAFLHYWEKRMIDRVAPDRLLNIQIPGAGPVKTCPLSLNIHRQLFVDKLKPYLAPSLRERLSRGRLRDLVIYILEARRLQIDPRDMLHLYLLMIKFMPMRSPLVSMFRRYLVARLKTIRFYLPVTLTVRALALSMSVAPLFSSILHKHIASLNIHPWAKKYYLNILSLVRVTPSSLGTCIFSHRRFAQDVTYQYMNSLETSLDPCPCTVWQHSAMWSPTQGHVFCRPLDWPDQPVHCLSRADVRLLKSNMKSVPPMTPADSWPNVCRALVAFHSKLYGGKKLLSTLLRQCRHVWFSQVLSPNVGTLAATIRHIQSTCRDLVIGPCDKDAGACWIMCPRLLLRIVFQRFFQSPALGGFTPVATPYMACKLLHTGVVQCGLRQWCNSRALSTLCQGDLNRLPAVYFIVKKRCFPAREQVAVRPITSHAGHSMKRRCQFAGRALSVLVRLIANSNLGAAECFTMNDSVQWWRLLKLQLARLPPGDVRLFEYDFDNMYYNINKELLYSLVQDFFLLISSTFRRRCVAVNKTDQSMDRLGSGSAKFYVNFSLMELKQMVYFDLFYNHVAHFGLFAFTQEVGVPMGGHLSAQLTSIFFIMTEIKHKLLQRCLPLGFSFFRFRDNLPGWYHTGLCSLTDIHQFFVTFYQLPVKLESSGPVLMSLESVIHLCPDLHNVPNMLFGWRFSPKFSSTRVPMLWSANRARYLQTVLPSLLLKCMRLASEDRFVLFSLWTLICELLTYQFSLSHILDIAIKCCTRHVLPHFILHFLRTLS